MRIHFNLTKALAIVKQFEKGMQASGFHVHGLSGDELAAITDKVVTTGSNIKDAVVDLGLQAKAAATAPGV